MHAVNPGGKLLVIDKNEEKLGRLRLSPWEQWFQAGKVTEILRKLGAQCESKFISYADKKSPDGLFIAWEAVRCA